MARWVVLAYLAAPAVAGAAESQAGAADVSLAGGVIRMLAALAVVIGAIVLVKHGAARWSRGQSMGAMKPRYIRVVETRFMAPKKSLLLVEVGGEYLLLSNSGEGLQFVKQIDMIEQIEVIGEANRQEGSNGVRMGKIISFVEQLSRAGRPGFVPAKSSGRMSS